MFGSKPKSSQGLEAEIRRALGMPDWLETVTVTDGGRAVLVIQAKTDQIERFETLRQHAKAVAQTVKGVNQADAILTEERSEAPAPPAPTRRVRKGARLSDEAFQQGQAAPAPAALDPVPGVSRILVVASAKGGVGKSTVSVNLAAALARVGMKVGLLDADIYGPSVPTMLGTADAQPGTTQDGRLRPIMAHGLQTLSIGYLSDPDAPMIWRGPIVMSAIQQMLHEAAWGDPGDPLDLMIIDTPPGTGDAQLALAQRVPVDAALIVTTPQEVALADVRRGAAMFAKTHIPVLGVVETLSWFDDPQGGRHFLMGEGGGARMARLLGLPLLAELPILQSIREGGDTGVPAALQDGAAGELFHKLARDTALAIDGLRTKQPPEIVFED
ncbi:MAG: Mrp/NBP35 family ATP-binding protein [Pseudomonadota bacterium]